MAMRAVIEKREVASDYMPRGSTIHIHIQLYIFDIHILYNNFIKLI